MEIIIISWTFTAAVIAAWIYSYCAQKTIILSDIPCSLEKTIKEQGAWEWKKEICKSLEILGDVLISFSTVATIGYSYFH